MHSILTAQKNFQNGLTFKIKPPKIEGFLQNFFWDGKKIYLLQDLSIEVYQNVGSFYNKRRLVVINNLS